MTLGECEEWEVIQEQLVMGRYHPTPYEEEFIESMLDRADDYWLSEGQLIVLKAIRGKLSA